MAEGAESNVLPGGPGGRVVMVYTVTPRPPGWGNLRVDQEFGCPPGIPDSQRQCRPMTPQEFIKKWGTGGPAYGLNERAGAQPHFMDLCAVLGVPTPGDAENYCFERGLTKTGTG